MSKNDGINKEASKKQAQEAAKRLFGNRTDEQNKALRDVKTIGSPANTIKPDSELFDDEVEDK
ncbi:hypothetical protein [Cellvibrio sp. QJXJ]|uniref:hypothetical protein n=1 Tax=Cellvibrio sp. QJXJ TaxID=2964606 RepID=UPI0021C3E0F9|nr:hypothetical protein [Cellvibrio sp. QJXJ]UUA71120.1 hypothetical protein NNX04_11940 [Cellvibrio sp. QJXJ]